jgi:hypothetical protein
MHMNFIERTPFRLVTPAAVLVVALAAPAAASERGDAGSLHGDVEVDPTAYALSGYSLHAGLGWRRLRVDLGAFAMNVPGFVHGNQGFAASFDGFGAKLQFFPLDEQTGLFVGTDAGLARLFVRREGTPLASRHNQVTVGLHAGWRFSLWGPLYATPWIGVSRAFNAHDVALDGATYDNTPWVVFPAVHIGYRFR